MSTAVAVCLPFPIAGISSRRQIPNQHFTTYATPPLRRATTRVSASSSKPIAAGETIFFDGGAHYGDLVVNLFLGFSLLWLPLTLAAVLRAYYLRYRFTNLRVSVVSGQDRSDFSYDSIKDVQIIPRFIGEWGDIVITLKDGTKVDLRSVPRFREIAKYTRDMAEGNLGPKPKASSSGPKGF